MLLLARYDVRLMIPFRAWSCYASASDAVGIASRCDQWQWRQWNCTNDQLFVIPQVHLQAFRSAIGEDSGAGLLQDEELTGKDTACFGGIDRVSRKGYGHGCYNSLARRIGGDKLALCWPPRVERTSEGDLEHNDYYRRWRRGGWSHW